ncbi:neuroligin 4-like [Biomphalaria glabrata]|uniref:Carboxylic ester hydrolase n=2 Tax=Biomphalaria glabrata TaxID=6526 RepID=A0A9W3AWB0_BIOGL|nr:neuroligin 4-like [Biomphalaria glabrata]
MTWTGLFCPNRYVHFSLFLWLSIHSWVGAIGRASPKDVIVPTTEGPLRGLDNDLTQAFRGIPFAAPPVGSLRWKPPQPPKSWRPSVLDAQFDAPGCPQLGCTKLTPPIACPQKTSEDCLYLNVFAPSGAKNGTNLPVMVYIHGGNFFYMSGSSLLFDGSALAQTGDVVVVTMNYRLGALGFLMTGDTEDDARGNYGLYDQVMALKWVKVNIAAFGGDPNMVTLFGQSAGAQSTLQHMTEEDTSTLFHRVIIESSPVALPYKTYQEAFILGGLLAETLGCPVRDMACLRSKPADQVAQAALATRADIASLKFLELFEPYGPYIDGITVKGQPLDVMRAGQFFKKPMIVGTTREETVLYIYGSYNKTVSIAQYLTLLLIERPDKFLEIAEHYKPTITTEDQRELLVNVSTDLVFWCPTRNLTRTLLGQGMGDIWMYLWDHAFSFPGWGPVTFCEGRVCHGTEIVYVFHTAAKGNFTFTKEEELLSSSIMQYWTNFAWTGDPNIGHQGARQEVKGAGVGSASLKVLSGLERTLAKELSDKTGVHPKHGEVARVALEIEASVDSQIFSKRTFKGSQLVWPKYSGGTGWTALHFQVPQNQIIEDYKADRCNFWDSIGYSVPK